MSTYKISKKVRSFGGESVIINKCMNGYFFKWQQRRKGKRERKSFCKLKLESQNFFYNIVNFKDKVKQISNLPQSKAAKMSENRKDWEITRSVQH